MLNTKYYVIGIDEVGRGCLAGPVTVTAVAVPANSKPKILNSNQTSKLKDSKKLNPKQREEWFEYIKQHPEIFYCTSSVSPKVIDKINISAAANLAAHRALMRLIKVNGQLLNVKCFLDGGLYIKNKKFQSGFFENVETLIRADEKVYAVGLASIVAKVTRDKYMTKLHKKYPHYQFDSHKGYGTKVHREAIKKHGVTDMHRESFCK